MRSSKNPQPTRITTAAPSSPSVVGLPQPQSLPLVMGSSRATRPADRPTAPMTSKRPGARSADSGTASRTRTIAIRPSPAEPKNRTCQLLCWATNAAAGMPSAPPMPSEELISAIAEPSRFGGSSSRMMLMPSGIAPIAPPWMARPITMRTSSEVSAQISEPTTSRPRATMSMRRLPNMSPSRPITGVATAPARRVAVMTQDALDVVVCSSFGRSATSGTTSVCMTETTMPQNASTVTKPPPTSGCSPCGPPDGAVPVAS